MNLTHHLTGRKRALAPTTPCQPNQRKEERRFCLTMYCLTDELLVRRVSSKAHVWLLTDEQSDHSWLMMGHNPICPHCGAPLVK